MATIQVTPETLREKATEIRTLKSEHDEVMNKMTNLIHALNEQWKAKHRRRSCPSMTACSLPSPTSARCWMGTLS